MKIPFREFLWKKKRQLSNPHSNSLVGKNLHLWFFLWAMAATPPFGSSLDCGACAASPGRHNARMLAKLANLTEVRKELRDNFDFKIPDDTIFIGAEHNTTTDEITVFDSGIPDLHREQLKNLKKPNRENYIMTYAVIIKKIKLD